MKAVASPARHRSALPTDFFTLGACAIGACTTGFVSGTIFFGGVALGGATARGPRGLALLAYPVGTELANVLAYAGMVPGRVDCDAAGLLGESGIKPGLGSGSTA